MRLALVVAALGLCACGGGWEVAATDHPDSLTGSPGDRLFTLKIISATEPFPLAQFKVTAGQKGDTPSTVLFDHDDADGDGKLSAKDNLVCVEGPVNHFDQAVLGKSLEVVLIRDTGAFTANPNVEVAKATWSAN